MNTEAQRHIDRKHKYNHSSRHSYLCASVPLCSSFFSSETQCHWPLDPRMMLKLTLGPTGTGCSLSFQKPSPCSTSPNTCATRRTLPRPPDISPSNVRYAFR